ncbi:MAG: TraB/GumN family protein [Moraxellaceae bacterium]|nr:TraB/GumN family protein [Moraxellaceae bacterium]
MNRMSGWRALLVVWLLVCAAGVQAAGERLSLWEVTPTAGGARGKVYLFGSIHVCGNVCYPLSGSITRRFEAAPALAVELDPLNPDVSARMMKEAQLPAGQSLSDGMSSAERRRYEQVMARLGLPGEVLMSMKPWMAATVITLMAAEREGYSATQGIDMWFVSRAREAGKRVLELETAERQLAALTGGSEAEQMEQLRLALQLVERNQMKPYFDRMRIAWQRGDMAALDAVMTETMSGDSAWREALLDRRNEEMVVTLTQWLARGDTVFVVVGAGHMIGDKGLPALLAARGYKVRQIADGE